MTRWGVLLLLAYVALGLSPVARGKATHLAVGLTAVVLVLVMVQTGALR